MSACRGENDKVKNNQRSNELKTLINQAGFVFKRIQGGFIENLGEKDQTEVNETSFIIYNVKKGGVAPKANELFKFAMKMCRKYGQDSILYAEKGDKPRYYTKQGQVDSTFSNKFILNDKSQMYFSEFGTNKRFTLDWTPNDENTNTMKKKAKKATYGSVTTEETVTESYFNY